MTRVLVDTNVLVSYLLNRSPEQQRRAADLVEAAEDPDRKLLLHQLVLAETAFVLLHTYQRTPAEVSSMLRRLLEVPGAEAVEALDWSRTLELWPATIPDFLDAGLACAAELLRPTSVATFDKPFARKLRPLGLRSYW